MFSGATGQTYFFACNDWLRAGPGGDLRGCRKELTAGSPDAAGPANYRVNVFTSDLNNAGTDARVFLTVYGSKGDTGEQALDNSANNFERGKVRRGRFAL